MDVCFCKGGLSMLTRCKKALALVALAIFLLPCAALAATPDYPDHFAKYPAYKLGSSSTGVANYFDPATITCQSSRPRSLCTRTRQTGCSSGSGIISNTTMLKIRSGYPTTAQPIPAPSIRRYGTCPVCRTWSSWASTFGKKIMA